MFEKSILGGLPTPGVARRVADGSERFASSELRALRRSASFLWLGEDGTAMLLGPLIGRAATEDT
jgi:hypothetical protein